jgi:hypothetical protein
MKWFAIDSLPFPGLQLGDEMLKHPAPIVLRLTSTGPEMTDFWNAMSVHGWCELVPESTLAPQALTEDEARAEARAEIDAVVAKHLYGLERSQLEHIIGTFPTLER